MRAHSLPRSVPFQYLDCTPGTDGLHLVINCSPYWLITLLIWDSCPYTLVELFPFFLYLHICQKATHVL